MRYAYQSRKGHTIMLLWGDYPTDTADTLQAIYCHWLDKRINDKELIFLGNAVRLTNAVEYKKRMDKNGV